MERLQQKTTTTNHHHHSTCTPLTKSHSSSQLTNPGNTEPSLTPTYHNTCNILPHLTPSEPHSTTSSNAQPPPPTYQCAEPPWPRTLTTSLTNLSTAATPLARFIPVEYRPGPRHSYSSNTQSITVQPRPTTNIASLTLRRQPSHTTMTSQPLRPTPDYNTNPHLLPTDKPHASLPLATLAPAQYYPAPRHDRNTDTQHAPLQLNFSTTFATPTPRPQTLSENLATPHTFPRQDHSPSPPCKSAPPSPTRTISNPTYTTNHRRNPPPSSPTRTRPLSTFRPPFGPIPPVPTTPETKHQLPEQETQERLSTFHSVRRTFHPG